MKKIDSNDVSYQLEIHPVSKKRTVRLTHKPSGCFVVCDINESDEAMMQQFIYELYENEIVGIEK